MTVTDIFKDIKVTTSVERSIRNALMGWLPVYVQELEIQQDIVRGSIPIPASYLIAEEVEQEYGGSLPSIIVVSPGMDSPPRQEGDGSFRGYYQIAIAIIASANTRENTKYLVRFYSAAIAAYMMQNQSDYGDGTEWRGQSYDDDLDFEDNQTVNVGTNVFVVEVDNILNRYGGPPSNALPSPDEQPGSHWPIAETHEVEMKMLP